jgi:hypothetical protein
MAYLDAADILAAEQHLSLFLNSTILHSTLALAENRAHEAVDNIRRGIEIGQASKLMRPYYLGLLAEACCARSGPRASSVAVAVAPVPESDNVRHSRSGRRETNRARSVRFLMRCPR